MAVIQKIRNKYGKIAGGLIALSLIGFILMDAASGRFGDLFGRDTSIATVNGKKVDGREYNTRVKEYETIYSSFGNGKNLDDNTRAEIQSQAVENMIFEKAVDKSCDDLGIVTGKEEEKDIIYGAYPDQMVQQYRIFADPETGQFNPQRVKAFEQQANKVDPTGKMLEDWMNIKTYIVRNNTYTKFMRAVLASVYTPKFLLEKAVHDQETHASVRFVKVPYISVSDNEVKLTDNDVTQYMQQHAAKFTIPEAMRGLDYVSFDVLPSAEDTAKVLDVVNKAKTDLVNANEKEAENVVNRNSDERFLDMYVNKRTFGSRFADSIMPLAVGSVYGPYLDGSNYKVVKVLDKKEYPDSVLGNVILIAVSAQGREIMPDSMVKRKMDSISLAAQSGADFAQLAQKYSDDKYTKNDGKFTYSLEQKVTLPKQYAEFVFTGKSGEKKIIRDSTESFIGYFYVEIREQHGNQAAAKLAIVSKELAPSEATQNAAYAKANEFAGKNTTSAAFDETIKKEHLNKKLAAGVKASDFTIGGVGPAREMIRWAYEAKEGDVSPVFALENRYIVAKLTSIQDKGMLKLNEMLRPRIENIVKEDKKAKLIAEKYKSMNLDAIAQASNGHVQEADSFTIGSGYIQNLGFEPKVLGYCFFSGFAPNNMSPGIQGGDGVFFMSLVNKWATKVDPAMAASIYNDQRSQLYRQQQSNYSQQLRSSIAQHANVKYNPKNM